MNDAEVTTLCSSRGTGGDREAQTTFNERPRVYGVEVHNGRLRTRRHDGNAVGSASTRVGAVGPQDQCPSPNSACIVGGHDGFGGASVKADAGSRRAVDRETRAS